MHANGELKEVFKDGGDNLPDAAGGDSDDGLENSLISCLVVSLNKSLMPSPIVPMPWAGHPC